MVIAYRAMTIFFTYYSCIILLSERAKIFLEVLHFYNSEAKDVVSRKTHRAMVFKKLHEQGFKNHAHVSSVDKTKRSY